MTELERIAIRRQLARIVAIREAEQESAVTETPGCAFALAQNCSRCGAELKGTRRQAWNTERLCERCDK